MENYENSYAKFMDSRFPDTSYESETNDGSSEKKSESYNDESSYEKEYGDDSVSGESGDRYRRSADTYDQTYAKFIEQHFPEDLYEESKEQHEENQKVKREDSLEDRSDGPEYDEDEEQSESEEKAPKKEPQSDYDRIKSESLKQEAKQKPGNCKKIYKDNSVCKICKDPKTGDKSESCSYSSKPKAKKVAFSKHKKFSFKTDPEKKAVEGNDGDYDSAGHEDDEEEKPVKSQPPKEQKKPIKRNNLKKKSKSKPKKKTESDESDYGAYKLASYYDADYDDQPRSAKLQLAEQPDDNINTDFEFIEPYKFDNADFSRALSDFKYRDWSKCDKKSKGELTCYYCKDEHGFDQEECVYVSGAKPISSKFKMSKKYRKPSPAKLVVQPIVARPPFTSITQLSPLPFQTINQKYQIPSTPKPAHYTLTKPQTNLSEYPDNPNRNKKAIKRMITIKKQYYESDQLPQTETQIDYGKQV